MDSVRQKLFELQDCDYKDFLAKLIPTVNPDRIIGVRTPALRKYAKDFAKTSKVQEFLLELPHEYYDENQLHSFILCGLKDYQECLNEVNRFLPYVDNWATCDQLRPKIFDKHASEVLEISEVWLSSDKPYIIRFGIEMLMAYSLGDLFDMRYLDRVASIESEEYYVNMMIAWFFATALTKRYEETLPYIENRMLSDWCHKKTIQKARESRAIPQEHKDYLNTLK